MAQQAQFTLNLGYEVANDAAMARWRVGALARWRKDDPLGNVKR